MTDDEAAEKMKALDQLETERAHIEADKILCNLLRELYPKTVAEFEELSKWYS